MARAAEGVLQRTVMLLVWHRTSRLLNIELGVPRCMAVWSSLHFGDIGTFGAISWSGRCA